jgi:hypothetical protein
VNLILKIRVGLQMGKKTNKVYVVDKYGKGKWVKMPKKPKEVDIDKLIEEFKDINFPSILSY